MSTADWHVVDDSDSGVSVAISDEGRRRLSDEGLRRAANDNSLLLATARTHEILAGTACGLIVVAIVWFVFRSL
jgi:hypothetical protein